MAMDNTADSTLHLSFDKKDYAGNRLELLLCESADRELEWCDVVTFLKTDYAKVESDDMPPIYVQASKDDDVVNYLNSVVLDNALTNKNINHKFVLFETGGHGYGMKDCEFTAESKWQDLLLEWLCSIDVIRKP